MKNQPPRSASSWHALSLIVPLAAFVIAALDIVLLEKKFNVFSGGFLQTNQIVGIVSQLEFCVVIFMLEFALAASCWYAVRLALGARTASSKLSKYQFVVLYGAGSVLVLVAKYKILSYFGDFISMAVLRNLGGGDINGALLYALEEGQWFLVGAGVIGLAGWLLYRRLGRRVAPTPVRRDPAETRRLLAGLAVSLAVLSCLAYGASTDATARRHFKTVTPYWLADEFNSLWRRPEPSALTLLSAASIPSPKTVASEIRFGSRKDNLVLVVSESTRADVLDATIAGKAVTPNWQMLARDGSSGRHYYSHTGFTTSSLKAIFNGALGEERPLNGTLFQILKKNGYQIVVISGQDEAFGDIAKDSNLETAATIFFDARSAKNERVFSSAAAGSLALSNQRVVQQFDAVAAKIDWSRPVFFYINLQAAHFPYYYKGMPVLPGIAPIARGDISLENRAQLKLTYLNAVAGSDAATGQIVDRLKNLGVYDKSLVVVSGDHGESLFDDGILGHGVKITDAQMHTLLVANRKLPEFGALLGETELAHALLMGMGATDTASPTAPPRSVIQYIGDIAAPVELGYTYADGRHLVLDNVNAEVHASGMQKAYKPAELPADSWAYRELPRLVSEWRSMLSAKERCVSTTTGCFPAKK